MILQPTEPKKKEINHMTFESYEDLMLNRRLVPHRIDFLPRHSLQNDFMRRTIIIKNFPTSVSASHILSAVSKIKSTTFSMRFVPLLEHKAEALINNQFNNKTAKRRNSKKVTEKIDAETDEQNIEQFYRDLQEGQNKIFLTNIFIEFYAENEKELINLERKIKNVLSGNKITYDVLRFEQKEGFIGVSPLGKDLFTESANNIPSNTLAQLYPFSFSNRNDENGLFLGETVDGGYVFLDFDLRSEEITNGNFSIVGVSGQGKTWLMKKINSQMIFSKHSVFILDPDKDYVELIRALGGTVVNCASGSIKLNVFEVRKIMADYEINLGKTLKELRNHQGITQKELGKQLDLTSQAYSRYETGDRLPDLKMACRIARYYHITLDQLVCRGLHPDPSRIDPFATLPEGYRQLVEDYHRLPARSQERLLEYLEFLKYKEKKKELSR